MKGLFLHGWQSVPGGVKQTFLARHGHVVINPKLPDEDFNEASGLLRPISVNTSPPSSWDRAGAGRSP